MVCTPPIPRPAWGEEGLGALEIPLICFSILYFIALASVIALSILYVKHPNKHNNQQCNIKAIMKKKISIHVKLGVT